jgi:RNA polymerase sigma-70 factor (ECF subfamily)
VTEQHIWIREARKGNELAAYHLYESYAKAMYNTLIRMVGETETAQDLLQEAFVKAFRNLNKLTDEQAFSGWIKRIVINTGLEYVRKKKYVFEDIDEQRRDFEEDEPFEEVDVAAIHAAIKELPDGCRTVLSLHIFEGYKHAEIAEQLGITESTSKTQFRHAKQLLKKKLTYMYEAGY